MVSSAAWAQYHNDPTNKFPIGPGSTSLKPKKAPKNPVTSTEDQKRKSIPLRKADKFYPINGKPTPLATPLNKIPKPGNIWKKGKPLKHPSLYSDPAK